MENISSELEKLISYTLGRDVITEEDVEAICTTQVSNKIFDMITAIANRQTRKAMDLYEDLLYLKGAAYADFISDRKGSLTRSCR